MLKVPRQISVEFGDSGKQKADNRHLAVFFRPHHRASYGAAV